MAYEKFPLSTTLIPPPLYISIIERQPIFISHYNQRKEALLRKFTVCVLSCAFSTLLIIELSSALTIQSHSQQIQIHEEDALKLGTRTLKNWFHRQIVFGSLQPINGIDIPRIFKKTAIILPAPIHS